MEINEAWRAHLAPKSWKKPGRISGSWTRTWEKRRRPTSEHLA